MIQARHLILSSLLLLLATGCSNPFAPGPKWNPEHVQLFDDGIDLLENVDALSDQYKFRARDELDARSSIADTIAIVNVEAVLTNADLSNKEQIRLQLTITKEIYGSIPAEGLFLESSRDSLGYTLLKRHENRLSGLQLVFIRWFTNDDGTIGHHFHLSPPSKANLDTVKIITQKRLEEEDR